MKKTVLYIGVDYFGYEIIIQELIKKYLGYKVVYINLNDFKYSYKNFFEKVLNNLYYKNIKNIDMKNEKISKMIIKKIENEIGMDNIDIILYIRPQGTLKRLIEYLHNSKKELICHQWDTINSSLEGIEKYLKYFTKLSSFDPVDCKIYNMRFVPNFYLPINKIDNSVIEYDAFTIMSYDQRFLQLEELAKSLYIKNRKYLFLVYTKDKKIKSDYVTIINEPISLEKTYEYIKKSKSIVEIGHLNKQRGLSFRAMDSLGLNKKLITNYFFIKKYNFYNPKNIFIINEEKEIPDKFFEEKYEIGDKEIYESYNGENWIKNVFRLI